MNPDSVVGTGVVSVVATCVPVAVVDALAWVLVAVAVAVVWVMRVMTQTIAPVIVRPAGPEGVSLSTGSQKGQCREHRDECCFH